MQSSTRITDKRAPVGARWGTRYKRAPVGGNHRDKTAVEQMRLIQQLEEEDKQTIFKLIDKMLTKKKLNTFLLKI